MKEKIILNEDYLIENKTLLLNEAPLNFFYGKDVFFTAGIRHPKSILFQMIGNLGAYANDYEFDNSISVYVISDSQYEQMNNGIKSESIQQLEKKLNSKGQPFKNLLVITESALIEFVKKRTSFYGDKVTQELINSLQT